MLFSYRLLLFSPQPEYTSLSRVSREPPRSNLAVGSHPAHYSRRSLRVFGLLSTSTKFFILFQEQQTLKKQPLKITAGDAL